MTLVCPVVNAVSLLGLAHLAMPQMSPIASKRPASEWTVGRLFFFDPSVGGRVASANDDGSDRIVIVNGCRIADAIVGDLEPRHFYWTNIGVPTENDGSIEPADPMVGIAEPSLPKTTRYAAFR